MPTATEAKAQPVPSNPDRSGDQAARLCIIVTEPCADAQALRDTAALGGSQVQVVSPGDVGVQLWRASGPRVLVLSGAESVAAVLPWLALLQSGVNTATLVLLDAARAEVTAILERFDMWMPARTSRSIVAQQIVALWSLMERQSRTNAPQRIYGHNMVIDLAREEALDPSEQRIPLTPSEFRLLAAMAVQPGRVVDFWQLGAALPGHFRDADDAYNSVKVHIGRLRQKLAKATGWDGHLMSVRGRGFMFERRLPREAVPEANLGATDPSTDSGVLVPELTN